MKNKLVIITDENRKPMAWHEGSKQICYCTDQDWQDEPLAVRAYTVPEAAEVIKKTIRNRKRWGMSPGVYKTMPFTK
jgi:hypothetical protein